jgi:hypothetical protein
MVSGIRELGEVADKEAYCPFLKHYFPAAVICSSLSVPEPVMSLVYIQIRPVHVTDILRRPNHMICKLLFLKKR